MIADVECPDCYGNHLTPEERQRLEAIQVEKRNLSAEVRRIYDRARKRMNRNQ